MPPEEQAGPDPVEEVLTQRRLLGARLDLHTRVRLLVAIIIAAGAIFARYVLRVKDLDFVALVALTGAIIFYNAIFARLAKSRPAGDLPPEDQQRTIAITYSAIVFDYLALTVAIWLVGGARSPFLAFYLIHVILGCLFLSRRAAVGFTVLAYALLALVILGDWTGAIPSRRPEVVIGGSGGLDWRFYVTVLIVYALLFGLTAFLMSGVSRLLRRGERRIRLANAELARQADRRRDYLKIALHNLKSPIGAATMFLKNLRDGHGGPVTEKQREWLERSLARLDGLGEFMQSLLILSSLDDAMIRERVTEVDVASLLRVLVEEHREVAGVKEQTIDLDLPGSLPKVGGIERLVREAVVNYLTNAVKFTPPRGRISVRARSAPPSVRIEVEDGGPGVPEDARESIFEEFALPRGSAGDEAGKSSGLGLSIVRRVAEALGGSCGVESAGERGSVFYLELPAVT